MESLSIPPEIDDSEKVHDLTTSYMEDIKAGTLNPLYATEDLAGRIATEEINEEIAEEVMGNLGISAVEDD